jgi:ribosomal protein L7/L12
MTNTNIDKIRTVYSIMEKHGITADFYTALNFAEEVSRLVADLSLEDQVRNNPTIMQAIRDTKKIVAIKELRAISGASLLDSKNAVEAVERELGLGRPAW